MKRENKIKSTVNDLDRWDDGKFKDKYIRKLERNWRNWKGKDRMIGQKDEPTRFSRSRNLEGGIISELRTLDASFFIFFLLFFSFIFLSLNLGLGLE